MSRDSHPLSRAALFGRLDPALVALAPDGRHLAWLGDDSGVWRAFVAPIEDPLRCRPLTSGTGVSRALFWAGDRHLILFRDTGGDENYQAFAVDIHSGSERILTPPGSRALFSRRHAALPHVMLFQINDRDAARFDLLRIDVTTGTAVRHPLNTDGFSRVHADGALVPRLAERIGPDGGLDLLRRDADGWTPIHRIPIDDVLTSRVVALSDRAAFLIDSTGRDTAALVELDLETRTRTVLASDETADIEDVILSPQGQPLAVASSLHLRRWQALDPAFLPVLDSLAARAGGGQLDLLEVAAGQVLARIDHDDRRPEYVIHDTGTGTCRTTGLTGDASPCHGLRPMECVTIPARDGLALRSYLTRPAGTRPAPMVIVVHGGPYDRDRWGFSPVHQWLAGRGYAVLSVNFRGSTGFGKGFVRAADRQWGGRMLDDLLDGTDWAIAQGIADPQQVSIMGNSYGGYAALMAGALHPGRFASVTSIAGPTDLAAFVAAIPPYWRSWFAMIRERLADPDEPQGRAWLDRNSPLTHAPALRAPVLMLHGENDVRVAPSHARRMAAALAQAGNPATLAVFPDEGHFIARAANTVAMAALVEAFLASVTGFAVKGIADDLAASSLRIEAGGAFLAPLRVRGA